MDRRTAIMVFLLACIASAASGPTKPPSLIEQVDATFHVTVDREQHSQVLVIDRRYRIEILDETEDGQPDTWVLYENDRIRCKRWAVFGIGAPTDGELFDDSGQSLGVVLSDAYHSGEDEAEAIRHAMDKELEKAEPTNDLERKEPR